MTARPRHEEGAALIIVLLCLGALLILALGVSSLALRRQQQVGQWRGTLAGHEATLGAFDATRLQIESGALRLAPGLESDQWMSDLGPLGVSVRVRRQDDVAIGVDGRIVPESEATFEDRVLDRDGSLLSAWRRLEVYLVEAESEGTAASPDVRLLGGVARLDDGRTVSLGHRFDRRWR